MINFKKGLNTQQLDAVSTVNGPILILAGAGTGKTRVITYRTAYLLSQGIPQKNILCVTFTNKAANEMKERIKTLLGKEYAKGMTIMTFHALCVKILSREASKLGFKSKFNIYTFTDQREVIRNICKDLKIDPTAIDDKYLLRQISLAKNNLIFPNEYHRFDEGDTEGSLKKLYSLYQQYLKEQNAFDFDDLLLYTAQLFSEYPDVLNKYQNKFRYIMIDEYQDTNKAQYRISWLLCQKYKNICVVGDDDQSIYAFRGANIYNILNFEKDFPGTKVIKLEENYRSTKTILEAAHAVIEKNKDRKSKKLRSNKAEGKKINTIEADHAQNEAEKIIDDIWVKMLKNRYTYKDFAILYRINAQSRSLEEELRKNKIPYHLVGEIDFYERKEIKDILCYLRVLNNIDDDLSLMRILNYPKRGIGVGSLKKINEFTLNHQCSIFDALTRSSAISDLSENVFTEINHFTQIIQNYAQYMQGKDFHIYIREMLEVIGFFDEVRRENTDPVIIDIKIQNIGELLDSITAYCKRVKKACLSDYLLKLSLMFENDKKEDEDLDKNEVSLMTIHAAKGLEFRAVYLIGFENGYYPHIRNEVCENFEEERRLTYVAITRAQEELCLSLCAERMYMGEVVARDPSPFLDDIPDELIIRNYARHIFNEKKDKDVEDDDDIIKESLSKVLQRLKK